LYHLNLIQIDKLYQKTLKKECKTIREILRTKIAMAVTNPELIAPLLFTEKGMFARVVGEVLQTFSCKLVQVKLAITEKCTNELPIVHKGKQVYLHPITRIITDENYQPRIINKCTNILDPMYQLETDSWITVSDRKATAKPEKLELPAL